MNASLLYSLPIQNEQKELTNIVGRLGSELGLQIGEGEGEVKGADVLDRHHLQTDNGKFMEFYFFHFYKVRGIEQLSRSNRPLPGLHMRIKLRLGNSII